MIAAVEVRSTLRDGTRLWHVVQTSEPRRAVMVVADVVGLDAVVELTGTTFHAVGDGRPRIELVHQRAP